MKLIYTEFRPSVNRSTVEVLAEVNDAEDFGKAVLKEIGVCMDNDAWSVAHKLVDWHREATDNVNGLRVGAKLEHTYGDGRDPRGTWELTE